VDSLSLGADPVTPTAGIGMLGHGFIGKAHVHAYRTAIYMTSPPLRPSLVELAGRDAARTEEAARRYGFDRWTTDWEEMVRDERVDLFDNSGPNDLHAAPTIAAVRAGKHVLCEKPLGRTGEESYRIWQAAEMAEVVHMCSFNYRFVPAVLLARELIEAGELGEVHSFHGSYLQDWLADPSTPFVWRLSREQAGSGALGDIGAHVIDLARFLVGEIASVSGRVSTVVLERPGGRVDVDDAADATFDFERGGRGSLSVSRVAHGHRSSLRFEINGSKGSVAFDVERLNELEVYIGDSRPGERAQGFRRVLVTDPGHPYVEHWWPPGHVLGWADTFVHQIDHLLRAIGREGAVAPYGATFEDGYRVAEVCDAILASSETGAPHAVTYRRNDASVR